VEQRLRHLASAVGDAMTHCCGESLMSGENCYWAVLDGCCEADVHLDELSPRDSPLEYFDMSAKACEALETVSDSTLHLVIDGSCPWVVKMVVVYFEELEVAPVPGNNNHRESLSQNKGVEVLRGDHHATTQVGKTYLQMNYMSSFTYRNGIINGVR
jgi:hypothetical protein